MNRSSTMIGAVGENGGLWTCSPQWAKIRDPARPSHQGNGWDVAAASNGASTKDGPRRGR